jgi:hypothetical protein
MWKELVEDLNVLGGASSVRFATAIMKSVLIF